VSRLRAFVGVGALACSLALSLSSCKKQEPTPGPLAPTSRLAGQTGGFRIKPHDPVTFAEVFLRNSGGSPGLIENVELVDATEGIKIIGSLVAIRKGEEGPYSPGGYRHFHPPQGSPPARLRVIALASPGMVRGSRCYSALRPSPVYRPSEELRLSTWSTE
jgi:hypothetical protein